MPCQKRCTISSAEMLPQRCGMSPSYFTSSNTIGLRYTSRYSTARPKSATAEPFWMLACVTQGSLWL